MYTIMCYMCRVWCKSVYVRTVQCIKLVLCCCCFFQDSLGGNAMTNLVANVHPSARYVYTVHVMYVLHELFHDMDSIIHVYTYHLLVHTYTYT